MRYLYARVSTQDQSVARQIEASKKVYNGEYDEVFSDKKSGKDFDRPDYQRMKSILQRGDELVIKSIDRLGRNKADLQTEIRWMKEHGIILRILDVPTTLMECQPGQEWIFDMVNNIIIEVLSAVAQQELEKIRSRTKEGIAALPVDAEGRHVSPRTGNRNGRPPKVIIGFEEVYQLAKDGKLTYQEAWERLGIKRTKWYELIKQYEAKAA